MISHCRPKETVQLDGKRFPLLCSSDPVPYGREEAVLQFFLSCVHSKKAQSRVLVRNSTSPSSSPNDLELGYHAQVTPYANAGLFQRAEAEESFTDGGGGGRTLRMCSAQAAEDSSDDGT